MLKLALYESNKEAIRINIHRTRVRWYDWSGDKDELVVTLKMAIAIGEWSQIIAMSSFLDIKKKKMMQMNDYQVMLAHFLAWSRLQKEKHINYFQSRLDFWNVAVTGVIYTAFIIHKHCFGQGNRMKIHESSFLFFSFFLLI